MGGASKQDLPDMYHGISDMFPHDMMGLATDGLMLKPLHVILVCGVGYYVKKDGLSP